MLLYLGARSCGRSQWQLVTGVFPAVIVVIVVAVILPHINTKVAPNPLRISPGKREYVA